jgi:hypothetical protein
MAFPTSPTSGQIAVVDGISYTYTAATNSWKRQVVSFSSNSVLSNSAIQVVDTFTGTGSQTIFTLSVVPPSSSYISVTIDGATQLHSAYTLVGNFLTLSEAPFLNETIEVTSFVNGGDLYVSSIGSPTVLNDISNQFDGVKNRFALMTDQTAVTSIIDSKNLEVIVNGLRLAPYINEQRYPWFTPYDSYRGFRVKSIDNALYVIIYDAPETGSQAILTIINSQSSTQTRKYPFTAATVALGD